MTAPTEQDREACPTCDSEDRDQRPLLTEDGERWYECPDNFHQPTAHPGEQPRGCDHIPGDYPGSPEPLPQAGEQERGEQGAMFMALAPPDDDDAAGWKELFRRRSEEYNQLAAQTTEAWAERDEARSQLTELQTALTTANQQIEELTRERDQFWNASGFACESCDQAPPYEAVAPGLQSALCPYCKKGCLVSARHRAEAQRDTLREGLEEVLSWEPHTEIGLDALHPQHRTAVETARSLLTTPPAKPSE